MVVDDHRGDCLETVAPCVGSPEHDESGHHTLRVVAENHGSASHHSPCRMGKNYNFMNICNGIRCSNLKARNIQPDDDAVLMALSASFTNIACDRMTLPCIADLELPKSAA